MTIKKEAAPKKPTKKKTAKKKTTKKKAAKKKTTKKKNYLNNKDLLAEVILSKEKGKMSDKLAHMLTVLCARYGRKGNFANYTYNEDMQAYAMMMLVRTWNSFKPEKSNNPFAFFTQCIKHSFIQFLNQEKRQRDIRDVILVDKGLSPSHTYQLEYEKAQRAAQEDGHNEDDNHNPRSDDSVARPKEVAGSEDILKY
jgi:DNA-directed RNA polymerase specialized sigma24 family protein